MRTRDLLAIFAASALLAAAKEVQVRRRSGMDRDGDGKITQHEISESRFFIETDSNGDGTLGKEELLEYIDKVGVGELFQDRHDVVSEAVEKVDRDQNKGIQGMDIVKHWERLSTLLTAEDVADWVSHAVLLPQYADVFKSNGVKGFDLPLFLEDPDYLSEIGVSLKLHRKQILRSISMRLLGIGRQPPQPEIDCTSLCVEGDDSEGHHHRGVLAALKWNVADEKIQFSNVIPVHQWRIFWRDFESEEWSVLGVFDGSHSRVDVWIPNSSEKAKPIFRIEAWNVVGRSEYGVTTHCDYRGNEIGNLPSLVVNEEDDHRLPNRSFPAKLWSSMQCVAKKRKTMAISLASASVEEGKSKSRAGKPSQVFRSRENLETMEIFNQADLDGDGDIDVDEMEQLVNGLSSLGKQPRDTSPSKSESARQNFFRESGAQIGIRSIDGDKDRSIRPEELETHWKGLQGLMTVDQTARWIKHAVELPQYEQVFHDHGVTGFDLPGLVANQGSALQTKLGIENERDRALLSRAITVLVMGIGRAPARLHHVDVRAGDRCATIKLDWSTTHAASRQNEMPIHKFVVLRSSTNGPGWDEIYSGMSTSFVDSGLSRSFSYAYRIEAWNLLGVSPSFETFELKPNSESCTSLFDVAIGGLYNLLMFPFYLFAVIADNYYRITAIGSVVGFLWMFSNMPLPEKRRVIMALKMRVTPFLKNTFGTAFGFDLFLVKVVKFLEGFRSNAPSFQAQAIEEDRVIGSPASPHHELINRAVEATFPSVPWNRPQPSFHRSNTGRSATWMSSLDTLRNRGGASRPSSPSRPGSAPSVHSDGGGAISSQSAGEDAASFGAGSNSKWGLVRQHLMQRRVVKAWASTVNDSVLSSDTESSSVASVDVSGSPRAGSRKGGPRLRIPFRRRKRKQSTESVHDSGAPVADSISGAPHLQRQPSQHTHQHHHHHQQQVVQPTLIHSNTSSAAPHLGNTKSCALCNSAVSRMHRHVCGKCHAVYCDKHTAHSPHFSFLPCGVESKCICVNCFKQDN